ncbi:hypothetical protein EYF80_061137 [Liparis tanakae]|uniref:Uncharacterized protein n=1 Tax=Liparis tanakae TaxID=230148 RepID=A0A4Z2EJU6_9TELE|nr:hypothetical protein EYF80_061137 [Liparis tanakae]
MQGADDGAVIVGLLAALHQLVEGGRPEVGVDVGGVQPLQSLHDDLLQDERTEDSLRRSDAELPGSQSQQPFDVLGVRRAPGEVVGVVVVSPPAQHLQRQHAFTREEKKRCYSPELIGLEKCSPCWLMGWLCCSSSAGNGVPPNEPGCVARQGSAAAACMAWMAAPECMLPTGKHDGATPSGSAHSGEHRWLLELQRGWTAI